MKLYSSASEVNMLKRGEKLRLLTHANSSVGGPVFLPRNRDYDK